MTDPIEDLDPKPFLPRVLPAGTYRMKSHPMLPAYQRRDGLRVIVTAARYAQDGKRWLHVSMSRESSLPSYEDVCWVKDVFVGADKYAMQVHPPRALHVNIHPNVLHLWSCLDGHPLPEFSAGTGSI